MWMPCAIGHGVCHHAYVHGAGPLIPEKTADICHVFYGIVLAGALALGTIPKDTETTFRNLVE